MPLGNYVNVNAAILHGREAIADHDLRLLWTRYRITIEIENGSEPPDFKPRHYYTVTLTERWPRAHEVVARIAGPDLAILISMLYEQLVLAR